MGGSEGAKSRCDNAVGDKKRGGSRQPTPAQRLCLHALALPHPEPSHPVVWRAMRAGDRVASPRHSPNLRRRGVGAMPYLPTSGLWGGVAIAHPPPHLHVGGNQDIIFARLAIGVGKHETSLP